MGHGWCGPSFPAATAMRGYFAVISAQASSMAAETRTTASSISASVMISGGEKAMRSPTKRVIRPCLRACLSTVAPSWRERIELAAGVLVGHHLYAGKQADATDLAYQGVVDQRAERLLHVGADGADVA